MNNYFCILFWNSIRISGNAVARYLRYESFGNNDKMKSKKLSLTLLMYRSALANIFATAYGVQGILQSCYF